MNPTVSAILKDLYEIDPELREHEDSLVPLVEQLLAQDPTQKPTRQFVAQLRSELKRRAAMLNSTPSAATFTPLQRFFYYAGGVITAGIILPVVYFAALRPTVPTQTQESSQKSALFAYDVSDVKSRAFGALDALGQQQNAARPQGGGGGGGVATAPAMDAKIAGDSMLYPMVQYDYAFDGTLPELPGKNVSVYRRNPSATTLPLSSLGSSLNLGNIDLSSFKGANVDSINFIQNTPFGYYISVNLRDGSVYIGGNWEQWPMSQCQTESCFEQQRVKSSDIPSDDAVIGIATTFANDHGIDLSKYGAAEIDKAWRFEYDRAADKDTAYIPDTMRVIFPLLIDGKPVYDQGGNKTGINIGVHVKQKRVFDASGIMSRVYEKSSYDGVTDSGAIMHYLETLDQYPGPVMPLAAEDAVRDSESSQPQVATRKVTLGTPTVSLATFYKSEGVKTEELLVPALIFPVKSVEGGEPFYRQTVVVPLAKDMLEESIGEVHTMQGMQR